MQRIKRFLNTPFVMFTMTKIIIKFNRDTCIGCGACVATCPDNWELDGDKVKPKKTELTEIGCNQDAKDVCPTDSIEIEEVNE